MYPNIIYYNMPHTKMYPISYYNAYYNAFNIITPYNTMPTMPFHFPSAPLLPHLPSTVYMVSTL